MKKFWTLLAALTLALAVTACGKEADTSSPADESAPAGESAPADEAGTPDNHAGKVTFTFRNMAEHDFQSVVLARMGTENWSENVLSGTLKARGVAQGKFALPDEDPVFDVKATTASGESFVFRYLDLAEADASGGEIVLVLTEGGDGKANFIQPE